VTQLEATTTPVALFVPFAAVPMIVTLPEPVAEIFAEDSRITPGEYAAVLYEVPLTEIEPVLVVTADESTQMPQA
jgi:hypothetical protein